ncbi:MAG: FliG C-terminal domain-containing protein [Thiobacillaceae bacterium]
MGAIVNQAGLEKSAVLLMAVGEAAAGHILRYLNPTEVTQLAETMRRVGGQSRNRVAAVLADFQAEAERQTGFGMAPQAFLGEALTQALGEEKAAALLARLEAEGAPLKQLAWMAPAEISHLLGQEPAPVIATVLAHLEQDQAAEVLMLLPPPERDEALLSLARWQGAAPEALSELSGWLASRVRQEQPGREQGEELAASLLRRLPKEAAQAVNTGLAIRDPALAGRLAAATLTFQDLIRLDNASRTRLFKAAPAQTLLQAMKGADPGLVESLAQRMGGTAARRLKDDLDTLGAVRVDQIEAAQEEVVRLMRQLAGDGELSLESLHE